MLVFFFNDTATTEFYPLSLHDALPISGVICFFAATSLKKALAYDDSLDAFGVHCIGGIVGALLTGVFASTALDRKSTRLNSSHSQISYAVFCLKKKNHSIAASL